MKRMNIFFTMVFSLFVLGVQAKKPVIVGSGVVKIENRDVTSFSRLIVSDAIDLKLTKSATEGVRIEAEDNILPLVVVESGGDKLSIRLKDTHSISTKLSVRVYVSYKQLSEIFVSGASKLSATEPLDDNKILLILSGASHANLDVKTQWLSINCSEASKAVINGDTKKLNVQCSGASSVDAQKLSALEADADASGASQITLIGTEQLNITASGASVVRYLNYAGTSVTKNVSGASTVVPLDAPDTSE